MALPHNFAHGGMAGNRRDDTVDTRVADLPRDVVAGDPDLVVTVEGDRIGGRGLGELRLVSERNGPLQREPGEGSVHRAGIDVPKSEPLGEPLRDGALARSRRPVYRNDHA